MAAAEQRGDATTLASVIAYTSLYAQSDGPNDVYPAGGYRPQGERRVYVGAALAGVELGAYDHRIVEWLTQWDDYTARLVVSLLVRARRAGYADAGPADGRCRDCGGPVDQGRP